MQIETGTDAASVYEAQGGAEEAAKIEAAKAELLDESQQAEGEANGLILGKYGSVDDLAQAYKSLQSEYSRLKNGQSEPAISTQTAEPETAAPEAEESQASSDTGLSPEQTQAIAASLIGQAGGEAEYRRLTQWAADPNNVSAERVNAYNDALTKGDQLSATQALKAMQYDYLMRNGYEPKLVGGSVASAEVAPFESQQQVVKAMNDPRYSGPTRDPVYIKEIEARMAVSNLFSTR
jgi:hypothetical protein